MAFADSALRQVHGTRIGITDVSSNGETETGTGETHDVYDFKINRDNLFLKSELKTGGDEVEMICARWKYGFVLIGFPENELRVIGDIFSELGQDCRKHAAVWTGRSEFQSPSVRSRNPQPDRQTETSPTASIVVAARARLVRTEEPFENPAL